MKYLSTLLAGFHQQSVLERKLTLAQLAGYEPDVESEEARNLLWREAIQGEAETGPHARSALAAFLKRYTIYSYREGLDAHEPGGSPDTPRLRLAAAADLLKPGLFGLLDADDPKLARFRPIGAMALGCFGLPDIIARLQSRLAGPAPDDLAAFALSEIGGEAAAESLVPYLRSRVKEDPHSMLLFRSVPGPLAVPAILEAAAGSPGETVVCAALTLSFMEDGEALDALGRLAVSGDPAAAQAVLVALLGTGDPASIELIRRIQRSFQAPEIQALAMRAVAGLRIPEAHEILDAGLASPHVTVVTAAMESWLTQEPPPRVLARARQLVGSEDPGCRFFAALALSVTDPEAMGQVLKSLLISEATRARYSGAQLLGYLRSRAGVTVLERMARSDPSPAVRGESVLSIARYDPDMGWPALIGLTSDADPETSGRAARALAGLPGEQAAGMAEVIAFSIRRRKSPEEQARLLPVLGLCAAGPTSRAPPLLFDSIQSTQDTIRIAALRGMRWLGDRVPPGQLESLALHRDPRIRARAALALALSGELAALETLSNMLASKDVQQVQESVLPALEIAILVSQPLRLAAFTRLDHALQDRRRSAEAGAGSPIPAAPVRRGKRPTRRTCPVIAVQPAIVEHAATLATTTADQLGSLYETLEPPAPETPAENHLMISQMSSARVLRLDSTRVRNRDPGKAHGDEPVTFLTSITGGHPRLGALLLALVGAAAAVLYSPASPERSPGTAHPQGTASFSGLSVQELRGTCVRHRAGGVTVRMHVGDRVSLGDLLRLEGESRLRLQAAGGGFVVIGAASEVEIGSPLAFPQQQGATTLVFREPLGSCEISLTTMPSFALEMGGHLVQGIKAHVSVETGKEGRALTVRAGELIVYRGNEKVKALGEGEQWIPP